MRARTLALLLVGALLALPAAASPKRVEAIGAVPAEQGRPGAVRAGLDEAVRTVLRQLLSLPPDERLGNWSKLVGGGSARDYTIRYRVLDDIGERAALLVEGPAGAREYVVVVEATVDEDALRAGLRAAGALGEEAAGSPTAGARTRLVVETAGNGGYPALESLERRLASLGAGPVLPVRFAAGTAVYEITPKGSPERLLQALRADPPAGTRVLPIQAGPGELRLRLDTTAPAPPVPGAD